MKYSNHYKQLSTILRLSPPSTKKIAKQITHSMLYHLHKTPHWAAIGQLGWAEGTESKWEFPGFIRTLHGYKSELCIWKKSKQKWQKRQVLAPSPFFMSSFIFVYILTQTPKGRYLWYWGQLLSIKSEAAHRRDSRIFFRDTVQDSVLIQYDKRNLKYP